MQERIREELRQVVPLGEIADAEALESLPLFNSFLKETLRRWPTLPGPLERIVSPEGIVVSDVFVPGGVSSH